MIPFPPSVEVNNLAMDIADRGFSFSAQGLLEGIKALVDVQSSKRLTVVNDETNIRKRKTYATSSNFRLGGR